mgnify:CR=1 FL=1
MKRTPKEIVDRYVPKKPSFITFFISQLVAKNFTKKHPIEVTYNFDKKIMNGRQVLLLSDHACRDIYYHILATYPFVRLNAYVGYQNLFNKSLFRAFLLNGVIPKYLFSPDIKSVKDGMKLVKNGRSILLFPEGIHSDAGYNQPINPATAKLISKFKIDVVLCKSYGEYLSEPRFNRCWHKGKTKLEYIWLFKKEELDTLSVEDINKRLLDKFQYNDFMWNKKEQNKYYGEKPNAYMLDMILYRCPKCGCENKMKVVNDKLMCGKCGNTVIVDEAYNIKPYKKSTLPYERIDEWFMDERMHIREKVLDENFNYEFDCTLIDLATEKLLKNQYIKCGQGNVKITKDKIIYIGTRYDKPFTKEFMISSIPSTPFTIDNCIEFFYNNEYYSFKITDESEKACKIMMIIEELHMNLDPSWKKARLESEE